MGSRNQIPSIVGKPILIFVKTDLDRSTFRPVPVWVAAHPIGIPKDNGIHSKGIERIIDYRVVESQDDVTAKATEADNRTIVRRGCAAARRLSQRMGRIVEVGVVDELARGGGRINHR